MASSAGARSRSWRCASSTRVAGTSVPSAGTRTSGFGLRTAVLGAQRDSEPEADHGLRLVLVNARGVDRNRFYRQVISYTCVIVALGPIAAWAALVLPGSF